MTRFPTPIFRMALAASLTLLSACGGADADFISVSGTLDRPANYNAEQLARLPVITQTVTYTSGGAGQTKTYTGPTAWTVLSDAGIKVDAAVKNDILNKYVVATGSDGYKVAFSAGELHPEFGNRPSIVAYAETKDGTSGTIDKTDAPFRITSPGDGRGGRYVSMMTTLELKSPGSAAAGSAGGIATSFRVTGAVNQTMTFDLAALQSLPAGTQTVGGIVYTGVPLWTILNTTLGLKADASDRNPSISMYAVATGSDGYKAVVALGEIDPNFGKRNVLLAYASGGAPLGANGVARMVVPGDTKLGRSVSNLVSIEVFSVK